MLIKALKEMGHSDTEIATRLKGKVSRTSIHFLSKAEIYNPEVVERIKKYAASHWWLIKHNALMAITPEKLEESSALQLATIAGISTEKARLIEGDSTSNVHLINQTDQELENDITRLEYELAQVNGETVAVQKSDANHGPFPQESNPQISNVPNVHDPDTLPEVELMEGETVSQPDGEEKNI